MKRRREPRSPLQILTEIAEHFLSAAEELDERVEAAVAASASQSDIVALVNLADEKRMRAATTAEKAIGYTAPRLAAIEVAAASPATRDRFAENARRLTDDEALKLLAAVEAGTMTRAEVADELDR
jgi:hypothetical protein